MSWMMASSSFKRALADESQYPLQSLRQLENDPRVKACGCGDYPDVWEVFGFGAEIQRQRGQWFIFQARSRFYAIQATTERGATRIIEQYRVTSPAAMPAV
jgi:hypothetical protein